MDKRIGTTGENGTTWPEVNIEGAAYDRPATTIPLGDGYFVVIPVNWQDKDNALGKLRAGLKAARKPEKEAGGGKDESK